LVKAFLIQGRPLKHFPKLGKKYLTDRVIAGDIKGRLQVLRDRIRKHFLKYTIKAFQMLPQMEHLRIIDISCGSGVSTIELAKLSQGGLIS
jgi:hypothetical protein